MKRKEFIKKCCFATAGVVIGSSLLESCSPVHYANGVLKNDTLVTVSYTHLTLPTNREV